jgi:hypothetical protein
MNITTIGGQREALKIDKTISGDVFHKLLWRPSNLSVFIKSLNKSCNLFILWHYLLMFEYHEEWFIQSNRKVFPAICIANVNPSDCVYKAVNIYLVCGFKFHPGHGCLCAFFIINTILGFCSLFSHIHKHVLTTVRHNSQRKLRKFRRKMMWEKQTVWISMQWHWKVNPRWTSKKHYIFSCLLRA